MKVASCRIIGITPISFSAPVETPKKQGEPHDAYEERTWRERAHVDKKTKEMYIPGGALKGCLQDAAKYLSEAVPGKGKATYTKHFEAGVLVPDPLMLGVTADKMDCDKRFVPSDGKPGGGSRVWKKFPILHEWSCDASMLILDPVIEAKPEKILEYLTMAGRVIGMGRFRPRNRGTYGRFEVSDFRVEEYVVGK